MLKINVDVDICTLYIMLMKYGDHVISTFSKYPLW